MRHYVSITGPLTVCSKSYYWSTLTVTFDIRSSVRNYSWSYENIHTKLWVCRLRLEITFCRIIIAVKSQKRRGGSNHRLLDYFFDGMSWLTTKETSKHSTVDIIICNICSCPYETIHTEVSICRLRFKKSRFAALSLPWSNMSDMASPNHYQYDCSFHNLLGLVTKGTNSKALYSWDFLIHYFGESRFVVSSL